MSPGAGRIQPLAATIIAMVEIRRLQPMVKLRMPVREAEHRPSQRKTTRRSIAEFPSPTPQPTPCRLWQGIVDRYGYGRMKVGPVGKKRPIGVHRWVMEVALDRPLKPTEFVMHACDQPLCYRVDHLSIGTVQANNADMFEKSRGHPPPRNVFYGEDHPMRKLNVQQVEAIKRRYRDGLRFKTIAEEFNVSPSQVRRIVRGIAWATGPPREPEPRIKHHGG